MKILITGGAGYIGSVLTPTLLGLGHEVTVVDNFYFRQNSLTDCCHYEKFQVVRGDCRDEALDEAARGEGGLDHPAGRARWACRCANSDQIATQTTNYEAVAMLCRLASPQQRMIMPVTNSGYGIGEKGKFCTEDSPLRPLSTYGITKVKAEEAVLQRENGMSFRLATVFGMSPRMRLDLLVNDFVYRAVNDRAVLIFEGHFKRNYIHIRDVVRAFIHGMEQFREDERQVGYITPGWRRPISPNWNCARSSRSTCPSSFMWKRRLARTRTSGITSCPTRGLLGTGFKRDRVDALTAALRN